MAIVYDGMKCPICKETIDLNKPYFTSFAFAHPLSDTAIHWHCLFSIPGYYLFLNKLYETHVRATETSPYQTILTKNKDYMISTNGTAIRVSIRCSAFIKDFPGDNWPENFEKFVDKVNLAYLPDNIAEKTRRYFDQIQSA